MWAEVTDWVVLGAIAVLSVYDVYLVVGNQEERDTISSRVRHWGECTGLAPFGWGVLAGHFFGPTHRMLSEAWAFALLPLAGLVWLVHRLIPKKWVGWRVLCTELGLGVVVGALLWSL